MRTLAHEVLDIESGTFRVPDVCYEFLDNLLAKARDTIDVSGEPEGILSAIGNLLEQEGFALGEDDVDLFSRALRVRNLKCRHSVFLYFSVGEILNLSLAAVFAPGHVFIRWNDGVRFINWETTCNEFRDDDYYIDYFNIDSKSVVEGVYLNTLRDTRQILSSALLPMGVLSVEFRDYKKSLILYNLAIDLYDKDPLLYNSRGNVRRKLSDLHGALSDYNRAIELDPNFGLAYRNRGDLQRRLGNYTSAIDDYQTTIKLGPKDVAKWLLLKIAMVRAANGDLEGTLLELRKTIAIDPDLFLSYVFRGAVRWKYGNHKGAFVDFALFLVKLPKSFAFTIVSFLFQRFTKWLKWHFQIRSKKK